MAQPEVSGQRRGSLVEAVLARDKNFAKSIAGFKIVDIDPAAAQFHASYPDTERYDVSKVCPNVAPIFPRVVLEAGRPPGLEIGFGRSAVMITAHAFESAKTGMSKLFKERPHWQLTVALCGEQNGHFVQYPELLLLYVYGNGELVVSEKHAWAYESVTVQDPGGFTLGLTDRTAFMMDWFIAPALFAISLTHCKGVSLRTVVLPEHHSKKVRRRRSELPRFEHHVIEIRDRQNRIADGEVLEEAIVKGLHIVRGHFSTYTPEAPLFGRVRGTFWIPAHIRGAVSHGLITSEYVVQSIEAQ